MLSKHYIYSQPQNWDIFKGKGYLNAVVIKLSTDDAGNSKFLIKLISNLECF